MNLLYCPECGTVYLEGTPSCCNEGCRSDSHYPPYGLSPIDVPLVPKEHGYDTCSICGMRLTYSHGCWQHHNHSKCTNPVPRRWNSLIKVPFKDDADT